MNKVIKAAEIEEKFPGVGRDIGAKLAEIVEPGDIIDFEGFISITNSFADEFVKCFIKKNGKEAFHKIKFKNADKHLLVLLDRAFKRRTSESHRIGTLPEGWKFETIPIFPD